MFTYAYMIQSPNLISIRLIKRKQTTVYLWKFENIQRISIYHLSAKVLANFNLVVTQHVMKMENVS